MKLELNIQEYDNIYRVENATIATMRDQIIGWQCTYERWGRQSQWCKVWAQRCSETRIVIVMADWANYQWMYWVSVFDISAPDYAPMICTRRAFSDAEALDVQAQFCVKYRG